MKSEYAKLPCCSTNSSQLGLGDSSAIDLEESRTKRQVSRTQRAWYLGLDENIMHSSTHWCFRHELVDYLLVGTINGGTYSSPHQPYQLSIRQSHPMSYDTINQDSPWKNESWVWHWQGRSGWMMDGVYNIIWQSIHLLECPLGKRST